MERKVDLVKIIEESTGLTAYNRYQEEHINSNLSPRRRLIEGLSYGVAEFFSPACVRVISEAQKKRAKLNPPTYISILVRDSMTQSVSALAFFGALLATNDIITATGSFLVAKLVLNGVIHYELNQTRF